MGGHHEHREGQGRSRSGAWEGYESLHKALEGLASAKGVSQSRIGAVAKLATHYAKFYKHVVHDIEVFLWKAEVEHRLAGLYAIDAIIRQSHAKNGPKDAYVKRFSIRLTDTIAAVKKVPEQQQPKVKHVIEEWQKRGVYTATQIEEAGGQEFVYSGNDQDERSGNITPRTSPGKLASLLSIIKQKKEEQDHTSHPSEQRPQTSYEEPHDKSRRQRDNTDRDSHNQRGYDDRRTEEQRYNRRDAGGIMGDAPGVPLGGRIRRAPEDRDNGVDDDLRDAKKARGSRWGPPRPDSNDRPAPIVTSLDRQNDFGRGSGRSSYISPQERPDSSRQAPLLQSPRGGLPRQDEWNRGGDRGMLSSRGSGSSWTANESVRSPQSAGRLDRGLPSTGRTDLNTQGGMQRSPFSRSDDRRSPRPDRIPGTSGEICRNFLAGRCTYGDTCWHIHDPNATPSDRPNSEPKRKTVLCNNYPLGKCRFGNNCSFAHGEDELDKSARYPSRGPSHSGRDGFDAPAERRWQPSPNARPGLEQTPQSHVASAVTSANAPAHQARSYGAPQAVYNEAHGDRGSREGDSSVSYANVAAPSPSVRQALPDQQPPSIAPTQGYPGASTSATSPYGGSNSGSNYVNQGPSSYSNQGGNSSVPPPSYGNRPAAPPTSSKALQDDDDADTAEPEFTLQYDDDD